MSLNWKRQLVLKYQNLNEKAQTFKNKRAASIKTGTKLRILSRKNVEGKRERERRTSFFPRKQLLRCPAHMIHGTDPTNYRAIIATATVSMKKFLWSENYDFPSLSSLPCSQYIGRSYFVLNISYSSNILSYLLIGDIKHEIWAVFMLYKVARTNVLAQCNVCFRMQTHDETF